MSKSSCVIDSNVKVRKHKRIDPLTDNRTLMKFSKIASRSAIEGLLEAGIAVVYVENGKLVQKSPDRKVHVLREVEPSEEFDLRGYLCQG